MGPLTDEEKLIAQRLNDLDRRLSLIEGSRQNTTELLTRIAAATGVILGTVGIILRLFGV